MGSVLDLRGEGSISNCLASLSYHPRTLKSSPSHESPIPCRL